MVKEISKCRICGNRNLVSIVDLGEQCLTGVFPSSREQIVTSGPLELVKCIGTDISQICGLVQLRHSYNKDELYGDNYGYRSSLNASMIEHLREIADYNIKLVKPDHKELIIDIGSNDGTLLNMYPENLQLVGIDPTIKKFKSFYKPHIQTIPDFFSSELVKEHFGDKRAKIITSIAMFYDLEDPIDFVRQITDVMDENGIWISEQSYLPVMLEMNSYDTICHEHLEYYSLRQLKWAFDKCDLKIIDIEFNDTNGGSIRVTASKKRSKYTECIELIEENLGKESRLGLDSIEPFTTLRNNMEKHKYDLLSLLRKLKNQGKKVIGYGASTKGNVILQYCGITDRDLPYIAEVNEDKFGKYTPRTLIPIISEQEAKAMKPDYFLVFPWHFRDNFLKREANFLKASGKFIFPLPEIEIIDNVNLGIA